MNENKLLGLAWISPYIIGLIVFTAFPFVSSFFLSFTEYDLMSPPVFNGIENYRYMLTEDSLFWKSMGVTFAYVFLTIPLKLAFALGIAFVLNFKLRGIGFFRTAYYIPSILGSSVAIAVLWRALFAIDGLLNSFLAVFGIDAINWLGEPSLALMSVTLLRVWQFGSAMVIFLAALQNVPQSQYEAAMIDGASKWQMFMKVTVPLITPVIFFNFIMQTTQAFQEFTGPYVITGGGPTYYTYLFSLYIYDTAFKYFDMGYGAALAWVLFLVVAVFASIAFKSSKYWVFYSADKGGKMADIQQMAPVMSDADREVARTLRREKVSRVVRYVVLIFVGLLMLYPLAWMFSASFKPNHEIFTTLGLWPAHATWDGFINGWKTGTEYHFGHYMLNTFKYVIPKVVLTIISSTIVAYGFARFEIPWKKFWFATLITTMLLPSTVLLIPQYLMFREMGMLNSYLPLYLPLAFATQGFFVFMLIQFLRGVPRDMEEAAQIDGCNSIQVLWYVVVPILKPAIISVALFQFMWSMNDFIGPLIYVYSVDKYPIALALKMSIDVTEGAPWNEILAMASISILPSIIVFFLAQRYFVQGVTSSGIKG
ncbi:sugar ABC transporter [Klebsiella pneumoniae]|nr:sugar ABC transporter [Klebsiella pneumoniae]